MAKANICSMANTHDFNQASISKGSGHIYQCDGIWTTHGIDQLPRLIDNMILPNEKFIEFELKGIEQIDTNGANILINMVKKLRETGYTVNLKEVPPRIDEVLKMVENYWPESDLLSEESQTIIEKVIGGLGKITVLKCRQAAAILGFLGEVFVRVLRFFPVRLRSFKQFLIHVERGGLNALPIVGLLSFLIGIVLAYQMGLQLERYGGTIFMVDFTGIAILREFGPLIAAIIFAGRTGSAFTSQIASMKISEEISALEVMGVSHFERLILPRISAMLICVPLVSVWANMTGLLGAMVMSRHFGIGFQTYLDRLAETLSTKTYFLGMIKTPVFALIIGVIGCYQGLMVEMRSDDVGKKTTKSVVQSIFLIIVADAIFSVMFSWREL